MRARHSFWNASLVSAGPVGSVKSSAAHASDRAQRQAEARLALCAPHSLLEAVKAESERRAPPVRFLQVSTDEVYGPVPVGLSRAESRALTAVRPATEET